MTKNEERINKLFKELVPETGKADSLAGELVRAMSRIGYRFYNDGDQLGIGYGKETCNPAGRFLDTGFAWNKILALSLISILPQLIVFFCAQDQFVEGISAGAVKG